MTQGVAKRIVASRNDALANRLSRSAFAGDKYGTSFEIVLVLTSPHFRVMFQYAFDTLSPELPPILARRIVAFDRIIRLHLQKIAYRKPR